MKTKFELKEINFTTDEFSNLLSDATYGTGINVVLSGEAEKVRAFSEENKSMCYEDLLAKWLYEGNELCVNLNECDEEDTDFDEDLLATFDLNTFENRLVEGYNNGEIREDIDNFINENDDAETGMNIIQYVAFQEIVIG